MTSERRIFLYPRSEKLSHILFKFKNSVIFTSMYHTKETHEAAALPENHTDIAVKPHQRPTISSWPVLTRCVGTFGTCSCTARGDV